MKRSSAFIFALVAPMFGGWAYADSIQVNVANDCTGWVSLAADKAPLSDVLTALSQKIGFVVEYKVLADRPVSMNTRQPLLKLIRTLTRLENLVLVDEADPQCPGQRRIVSMTLLPVGKENAPRPLPPPSAPIPLTAQQQEGLAIYRRAHGLDDNGKPKLPPPKP